MLSYKPNMTARLSDQEIIQYKIIHLHYSEIIKFKYFIDYLLPSFVVNSFIEINSTIFIKFLSKCSLQVPNVCLKNSYLQDVG